MKMQLKPFINLPDLITNKTNNFNKIISLIKQVLLKLINISHRKYNLDKYRAFKAMPVWRFQILILKKIKISYHKV